VADQLDDARLEAVYRIGVDEVSYRKGHRFLTVVADHDRDGAVIWAGEGKGSATLEACYDELGDARSLNYWTSAWIWDQRSRRQPRPKHPKHASARTRSTSSHSPTKPSTRPAAGPGTPSGPSPGPRAESADRRATSHRSHATRPAGLKHSRWALLKDPDRLLPTRLEVLHELRRTESVLYRCRQRKEGLRDLYRLTDPADAAWHLDWWLAWACRSRIPAFVTLSNSKLDGLNSGTRLINHRGYGHHSAALIAMIHLCCSGLTIQLPTER
jgi:transposase